MITAGVRLGITLGSPIALSLPNRDHANWRQIMQVEPGPEPDRQVKIPRPGHADLVGSIKYAHADMRNVLERASARETAMRVAIGTTARVFLEALGIDVGSRVTQIGEITDCTHPELEARVGALNGRSDRSIVRCLSEPATQQMAQAIQGAREAGDTLGGEFEIIVQGLPVGLGSYVQWDRRLEGSLAQAVLSLNAIRAVQLGDGRQSAARPGSKAHDEYGVDPASYQLLHQTNRAGGISGGMSNGQPLLLRATMKPLSTLMAPLQSVDPLSRRAAPAHVERSDVCAVPAAAVVAESVVALVIAQSLLEKFGGDSLGEISERLDTWRQRCPLACPVLLPRL